MYHLIYSFFGEIHETDFNTLEEMLWWCYQFIKEFDSEADFYFVKKENSGKSGFTKLN